ncbi:MAG: DNA polymerase IV, partial [Microbacterium sp.]
ASDAVMQTLREQPGAVVQVLGWDEAFVGVTTDDPDAYARGIQRSVLERTRLHCSVGIGDTLVRAKNATDFGKPRGTFRLTADNWLEVMGHRPTIALWGVGSKISKRLAALGIETVEQLARADLDALSAEFGPKMGPWYRQLGRGDGSNVVDDTPWVARGHGRETTFQQDIVEPAEISQAARDLLAQVLEDVAKEGRPVVGVGLKVRYAPFLTKTFTRKVKTTFDRDIVLAEVMTLVAKIEPDRPLRLLGVRAEMEMPDDAREGHTPTRGGW